METAPRTCSKIWICRSVTVSYTLTRSTSSLNPLQYPKYAVYVKYTEYAVYTSNPVGPDPQDHPRPSQGIDDDTGDTMQAASSQFAPYVAMDRKP